MNSKRLYIIFSICVAVTLCNAQAVSEKQSAGKIRVASCQFPVSADIMSNYRYIESQIIEAKLKKADVIHFPECALSGYPGTDMMTMEGFNWTLLHRLTDSVMATAQQLKVWVILGSLHKLSGDNKPHNSLYVISPEGKIADRYDKRFCTSTDLKYCSPGDHFVTFSINEVKCGLLICYDVRFPELYREYKKLGCDMIFQSFYNARSGKGSIHPLIMPVTAQAYAGVNYFYMSLTNSSAPESWPCHFITPDGLIQNKLTPNEQGMLISDIDLSMKYYDASGEFRKDAMNGKLNSGKTVTDPRSVNRKIVQ
jgi:predicted amidohydrolase